MPVIIFLMYIKVEMSIHVAPKLISNTTFGVCPTLWETLGRHKGSILGNRIVTCSNPHPTGRPPVWHYKLGLSGAQFPHLYNERDRCLLPFLPGPLSGNDCVPPPSCHPHPQEVRSSHAVGAWPFPSVAAGRSLPLGVRNWSREKGLLSYWMWDVEAQDSCVVTMFIAVGCRVGESGGEGEREIRHTRRWSRRAEMVQQGENALSFAGCGLKPSLKFGTSRSWAV